jgi:hypothetical protein
MAEWKSLLKADPTDWLLETDNPSVRYFTLVDLLDESPDDKSVLKTKKAIDESQIVRAILSKRVDGLWSDPARYYLDKYKGTSWQLLILAELGVTNENHELDIACEYVLGNAQDRESGGFAIHSGAGGGGRHNEVIPCFTGNMVFSLAKLGYRDDERVINALKWITDYQRFDDGTDKPASGWPYDKFEICWGRHTCHMGAVKALKALSVLANNKNKNAVKTINTGIEYMLKHAIFRQSHDLSKISKPGWLKFGFPLMYQTDALEIACILSALGCKDKRMQETMDVILSKQDNRGRWKLENTFNGRWIVDIEAKAEPSKWITLNGLRAVKSYYG